MRRFFICLLFLPLIALGQTYSKHHVWLQTGVNSAVFFPDKDVTFRTGFSSLLDLPFSLDDALKKRSDDSLIVSLPQLLSYLDDEVNFVSSSTVELFHLGFKLGSAKKTYVSLSSHVTSFLDVHLSKPFLSVLFEGNANYMGDSIVANSSGSEALLYHSIGASISRKFGSKFILSFNARKLTGIMNSYAQEMNVSTYTHLPVDGEAIYTQIDPQVLLHCSSLLDREQSDYKQNKGYSYGFGFEYQPNEKLSFMGAVQDIGKIEWNKRNNLSLQLDTLVQIESLINIDDGFLNFDESLNQSLDSLTNLFHIDTIRTSYQTTLPKQYYVGVNYVLNEKQSCSFLAHRIQRGGRGYHTFSISYLRYFGSKLYAQLTGGLVDGASNFGFGLGVQLQRLNFQLNSYNISALDLYQMEKMGYSFRLSYQINRKKSSEDIERKFSQYKNRF